MERVITASDLIQGLRENRFLTTAGHLVENYTINGPVYYQNFLPEQKPLYFIKCVFEGNIHFRDSGNIMNLALKQCIFKGLVLIENFKSSLSIQGSVFEQNVELKVEQIEGMKISDCSIFMQFLIQGVCKKCLEIENINVGDASFRGELTFTNITISHLRAKRLKLFSFVITVHTAIRNDSKLKEITAEYFALNKAIINDKMEIEKCRLTKIVLGPLEDSSSGSIHFYDNYQIDDAHLLLDTLKGIEINHGFFKKLTFSGTAKQKLIVQNINVEWLRLINVFNETSITFTSVTVPSISTITRSSHGVLEITSSNLGKADFLKCNFSQALFDFENSKIAEIFCSATTFPRRPINKTQEAYSQVQLAYGQLSAAFNKQGDSVRAYTYQSREIAAHFHNTSWKSADFFVWLNLALNKISNNFGRWWALGIVFTFLVGGLLFYLVVINSNEYSLGWGFDFNWDLFSSFLKFMNPLRFFDTESLFKLNENPPYLTLTRWSYFWDFFGRVFVAYGYYQTIQAFRRFGRK